MKFIIITVYTRKRNGGFRGHIAHRDDFAVHDFGAGAREKIAVISTNWKWW